MAVDIACLTRAAGGRTGHGGADRRCHGAPAILDYLGTLDERRPEERFAGSCRDFTMLLCAMLRKAGRAGRRDLERIGTSVDRPAMALVSSSGNSRARAA
jgi:hypothetical protein